MKRSYKILFCAVALLALALPAYAATKAGSEMDSPSPPSTLTGPNCDLTNYKHLEQTYNPPVPIVDGQAVTVGPIVDPPDGSVYTDVVIDMRFSHTWIGDLVAIVGYSPGCTGAIAAQSILICRPRGTGATTPSPCGTGTGFGCSGDAVCGSLFLFSDDATVSVADGICPSAISGGCYKPAPGNSLAVFDGMQKGGCWYLQVGDYAGGDTGGICQFSVHSLNERPVPTIAKTWGGLKTMYR